MSDKLIKLLAEKGSLGVLALFGLDQILTDQDDPNLWAAILARHWPAPGDPDMLVEGLRFGLAQEIPHDENESVGMVRSRSGMHSIEIWCFYSLENGNLKVKQCDPESNQSFFSSFITADPAARSIPVIKSIIDIQRPSLGCSDVFVHTGTSIPPNMGQGETRRWSLDEDGNWFKTEGIVFNWIS